MNKSEIMIELGCEEVKPGIYRHPDVNFDFDLSATDEKKVLKELLQIGYLKGRESMRQEFRELLGVG